MKSIVFLGVLASVVFAFPAGQKKQFKIDVKKSKSNSDMTHSSRVVSYLVKETQTAYNHGSGKLSNKKKSPCIHLLTIIIRLLWSNWYWYTTSIL